MHAPWRHHRFPGGGAPAASMPVPTSAGVLAHCAPSQSGKRSDGSCGRQGIRRTMPPWRCGRVRANNQTVCARRPAGRGNSNPFWPARPQARQAWQAGTACLSGSPHAAWWMPATAVLPAHSVWPASRLPTERFGVTRLPHSPHFSVLSLAHLPSPWPPGCLLPSPGMRCGASPAGCRGFPTDLCVPLSRLTETVLASQVMARRGAAGGVAASEAAVGERAASGEGGRQRGVARQEQRGTPSGGCHAPTSARTCRAAACHAAPHAACALCGPWPAGAVPASRPAGAAGGARR